MTWRQLRWASSTRALNPSSSIWPRHSASSASSTRPLTGPGCGGLPAGAAGPAAPPPLAAGAAGTQPEVVDPERRGQPRRGELVGVLVDHLHPQMVQPGQHIGEGDRRSGPVDRQPPDARPVVRARPPGVFRGLAAGKTLGLPEVESHRRAGLEHAAHPDEVTHRVGRGHIGLVGPRDGIRPAGEQFPGLLLAQPGQRLGGEVLVPGAHRGGQLGLQQSRVHLGQPAARARPAPPRAAGPAPIRRRSRCIPRPRRGTPRGGSPGRAAAPRWCTGPGAGTPGTTCTGRRRPGAGTAGSGGVPAAPARPARSGSAPARRSGTAPRAGSPRGSRSRPGRRGCPAVIPAASSTLASLRRSTGMRVMLSWYAACVNSPRNRYSPTISPVSFTRLTAM